MKIYQVSVGRNLPEYFADEESANKYLSNIKKVNEMGGDVRYSLKEVEVKEQGPDKITPAFNMHEAIKIYEVEYVVYSADRTEVKCKEYADLVPLERELEDYISLLWEPWLAQGVRVIVKSTVSESHAMGKATEFALSKLMEMKKSD